MPGSPGKSDSLHRLFVYGSLCGSGPHARAHRLLRPARWLGPATASGERVPAGRYPGARPHPCQRLHGQLYQLLAPRRSLYRLDRYEDCRPGNPRYGRYSRQRVPVEVGQQTVWAWIYWFRGPRSR